MEAYYQKLNTKEKQIAMMKEMGFNVEDGYDYLQHVAFSKEDKTEFYSCGEENLTDCKSKEIDKKKCEIEYDSYSASSSCYDETDMEQNTTDINFENIMSQFEHENFNILSNSRKRFNKCGKSMQEIDDDNKEDFNFDNILASYDESSIDMSDFCTYRPSMIAKNTSYEPIENVRKEEILSYAYREITDDTSDSSTSQNKPEDVIMKVNNSLSIAEKSLLKYQSPKTIFLPKNNNSKSIRKEIMIKTMNKESQNSKSKISELNNQKNSSKKNLKNETNNRFDEEKSDKMYFRSHGKGKGMKKIESRVKLIKLT